MVVIKKDEVKRHVTLENMRGDFFPSLKHFPPTLVSLLHCKVKLRLGHSVISYEQKCKKHVYTPFQKCFCALTVNMGHLCAWPKSSVVPVKSRFHRR